MLACAYLCHLYFPRTIRALENDMAAIRAEHETQNRTIKGHKSALEGIVADLGSLRFMGKERETTLIPESRPETPHLDTLDVVSAAESSLTSINSGSSEVGEEGEEDKSILDSDQLTNEPIEENDNDIEMGEVEEDPKDKNKKKSREDLEEGEATDASSELSEPPDD
jgi:THO complex subunit 7